MNKLLRLSYYLSNIAIVTWLIRPILFWVVGLEFADPEFEMRYTYSWRFILPIAICLNISGEFINGRRPYRLLNSIFIRLGLSAIGVFIVFMSLFTNMCGWRVKEVYFQSKVNADKIALMEYGCGAFDSDSEPSRKVKISKPLNKFLNWSYSCDTNSIDTNHWKRINF